MIVTEEFQFQPVCFFARNLDASYLCANTSGILESVRKSYQIFLQRKKFQFYSKIWTPYYLLYKDKFI